MSSSAAKLTREQIVRTALRLLDEVGLEGLTLRRIATELGVQAPALYWHVKNKEQLIDELASAVLDEAAEQVEFDAPHRDWRTELREAARFLRALMLAHRDGAKLVSGTFYTGKTFTSAPDKRILPILRAAGFGTEDATDLIMAIYHYTVGFVIEEQEVFPTPGQRDPRYAMEKLLARAKRDPAAVERQFSGDSLEHQFHSGIRFLIDGAAARIAENPLPPDAEA
ncbi:TetR/AcrR family transcriptional regulator C-terminal domain-containing protein [Sciscionella marina]|uniref:TetR/AcrR family transcriptional regulator C-terminal domain-containing protein n=1 Tax=Sciscionella marina TaxID=508770 RepID=UPI00037728A7|nr:TetR/AcrR family transcriptional regulator C-terminal domain-containing protein [Sciscionella marina]